MSSGPLGCKERLNLEMFCFVWKRKRELRELACLFVIETGADGVGLCQHRYTKFGFAYQGTRCLGLWAS